MNESATPTAAPGARQATSREFLAVVFRRKWIILGLFFITTLTVLAISLATPMSYISSGRVLLKRGEQLSVLEPDRRIYGDWEQELGTEVQLVKSVPVLEETRAILKRETPRGGATPPVVPASVDVEVLGKSNVIAIGYHHLDPDVAQRVCDAVIRAYISYRESRMGIAYPSRFFRTEIDQVRARLAELNLERRRFYDQQGVVDVDEQKRQLLAQITAFEQSRVLVKADLADAVETMRVMRQLQAEPGVDMPVPPTVGGLDALQTLKQRLLEQEVRIAQLRERYRDESPEVANANETLDTLRTMLRREVDSRIQVTGGRSRVLASRLASIDSSIAAVRAQLDQIPAQQSRVTTIEGELSMLRERERQIVTKDDEARVNENIVPRSSLILLSGAGRAIPTTTRDYVRLALAPAFSLVVGIGLAFFIDGLDITLHTPSQAEEAVELPVLATLPERRRRRG